MGRGGRSTPVCVLCVCVCVVCVCACVWGGGGKLVDSSH